jgi:hypothetical protein
MAEVENLTADVQGSTGRLLGIGGLRGDDNINGGLFLQHHSLGLGRKNG